MSMRLLLGILWKVPDLLLWPPGPHFWGPHQTEWHHKGKIWQNFPSRAPAMCSSISRLEVLPGRCPVPIADFTVNITVPQIPQFDDWTREVKGTMCLWFFCSVQDFKRHKMSQTICQCDCSLCGSSAWALFLWDVSEKMRFGPRVLTSYHRIQQNLYGNATYAPLCHCHICPESQFFE